MSEQEKEKPLFEAYPNVAGILVRMPLIALFGLVFLWFGLIVQEGTVLRGQPASFAFAMVLKTMAFGCVVRFIIINCVLLRNWTRHVSLRIYEDKIRLGSGYTVTDFHFSEMKIMKVWNRYDPKNDRTRFNDIACYGKEGKRLLPYGACYCIQWEPSSHDAAAFLRKLESRYPELEVKNGSWI